VFFLTCLRICSVKFLILRRIETDSLLKVHFSLCNYCKYLVELLTSVQFLEEFEISISFNLFSWNQLTATTKPVVTFLKFLKAPKIFHFVKYLKYAKKPTYLDSAWQ